MRDYSADWVFEPTHSSAVLERMAGRVDDDVTGLVATGPCWASTAKEERQDGARLQAETMARPESGYVDVRQWSCVCCTRHCCTWFRW